MNYRMYFAASLLVFTTGLQAGASQVDDRALENELNNRFQGKTVQTPTPPALSQAVKALKVLQETPGAAPQACTEATWSTFGGKYALSTDSQTGKPCRIYDLSFPTLKTFLGFFKGQTVSKIPVERFTSKDYLNWMRGNYGEVYKRIIDIRSNFNESQAAQASWVAQLKFKPGTPAFAQMNTKGGATLPSSFYASDLDIGEFKLKDSERLQLRHLFIQTLSLTQSGFAPLSETEQAWQETIERPESFLEKIRFDWNDLDKVYDVALEGHFLPLNGPMVLVDFNMQYKYAVEAILRSTLGLTLQTLARFIPNIAVRNIVYVAVTDSFDFLDMTYQSQLAQLEDTLRSGISNQIRIETDQNHLQSGLNILFGSGSSLFSEYILSLAQGQTFDWQQLEKLGKTARYREEKMRGITLANLNSRMVLSKGCEVERTATYFATCMKKGKKEAMYSLMTDQKIFMWNPGAPLVHNYGMPSAVFMKRSATWLLSAGLRVFDIPYLPRTLAYNLGYVLKDYARGGMIDEAHLKNHLWLSKRLTSGLSAENEQILKWLYIQNINPFLPKSEKIEDAVISANAALLGIAKPTLETLPVSHRGF
ncbi:MAG: hypothetical protein KF789_09195 [Bdellovibrionaceae bacterium]|nr:hypothetical protein [Pseudobdellovibrionaceae bacterium]